jgi:formate C-acetyltransferase
MRGEPPNTSTLARLGEHFAAGYFEAPEASPVLRWSRAVRRRFENRTPGVHDGGLLYPSGTNQLPAGVCENRCLVPSYSFTWALDEGGIAVALGEADAETRATLEGLRDAMRAEHAKLCFPTSPHTVGGNGYTHSVPHYGRVIREGLNEHGRRIGRGLAEAKEAGDQARVEFYLGMRDVLEGVRTWVRRLSEYVRGLGEESLANALERVPFEPARTFHEAVVAYNLVYYMDDCDNPGRLDQELQPFYEADLAAGRTTRDEAAALIAAFADNVKAVSGWSAAIGGTREDGAPGYNDVTLMCLESAHGRFRPSYELRVRPDMPDQVWEAALDAVATGSGNPAFYNEEGYLAGLLGADLGLTEQDATWWNGGGCTETMVHGRSNVGSLEAGLNMALVFEATMRAHLADAPTFEAFVEQVKDDVARTIEQIVADVNRHLEAKATWLPQPMRSLLIDDCLDRGVEYNAGGARYNWSVVNIAGLTNVIDSLAAIREVVFETGEVGGRDLLTMLEADFAGHETFRRRLARCPRFGNDDPRVDGLGADIAGFVFGEFLRHRPWRGGGFLPSVIMFVTYAQAGAAVGATPDGRHAGEPLGDSIGPLQGRDTHGPTAMLKSVAALPLHLAIGTPILNMRLAKRFFRSGEERAKLRNLIETFFELGGLQLQLSVVDRAELEDALEHPERHGDLIVRIGGYSEYFTRLSPELQRSVLERTEYAPSAM